ncbi:MAG: dTDP-4-dehydrorhamnose 3,5-epimerase [Pseudomonadota bacterium]
MKITPLKIDGPFVIEPKPFEDERGWFMRAFCQDTLAEAGLNFHCKQINMSGNTRKGTVRGLHFQGPEAPEAKYLRCVSGSIFDVVVDMRPNSKTYGHWCGVEISSKERNAIYVPPQFAHGYVSLTDHTEVLYMTDANYTPSAENGVRFDDPSVGIEWPCKIEDASEKDRAWPNIDPSLIAT